MKTVLIHLAVLVATLSAAIVHPGCKEEPTQPPYSVPTPELHSVAIEPNPHNVVSAVARINTSNARFVAVEYGTDSLSLQMTPYATVEGDSVTVPVLGLHANTQYFLRGVAVTPGSIVVRGELQSFTTDTLPGDFPRFTKTFGGNPSPGYVMLGFNAGSLTQSYAVIIDNDANVVFHRVFAGPVFDFQKHADGTYTAWARLTTEQQRFYRMDPLGNILQEYQSTAMEGTGPHEFRQQGTSYVYFGMGFREMDLTKIGGRVDARVRGLTVELFRPPAPEFIWSTFDHFLVTDAAPDIDLTGATVNPWHGNAIDFDTDGNLLVSFRNSDEITKINSQTGEIIWRLGGRRNQFTFFNDQFSGFSHQHAIRRLPNGNIILFDNGNLHSPQLSRAVEYSLDETALTATLVWEYRPDPPLYGNALGFAQRLANGNTLVCFGPALRIIEVDAAGMKQWEITLEEASRPVYRAFRIDSLY